MVIRNGNVTKFADGISFFDSVGVTVDAVNASFNTNNGMVLGQRTGIVAAEGAIVVNNEARNNQMDGISMDCPGAAIANTSGNNGGSNLTQINGSCVSDHNSAL